MASAEEKNSTLRSELFQGLESPFLNREVSSGRDGEDRRAHHGTLEVESAYLSAFEQQWAPPGIGETESEAFENNFAHLNEYEHSDEFEFEEPGIIAGDNRVRVKDTTGVPWRWICKIDIADSRGRPAGSGTGVLVSSKHVLTAAHVVYDAYKNMQQYTVTVIPALNDLDEPFDRYALASKPRIRQEYNLTADDSLDWDYALLTIGTSVGEKAFKAIHDNPLCYWASPQCGADTVFARLDPRTLNGKAAYTAGYPGGKGGKQLWCAAGILHSANEKRRTMSTTADTTKGQSGSPVWIIDNKKYCLVGIAVGAGTNSNRVVRVTRELVHQLRAWITEGGETPAMVETEESFEPPVLFFPQRETEPVPRSEAEEYEPPASQWSPELSAEEAEGFDGVDREENENRVLDQEIVEERFDPNAIPKDVASALTNHDWALALKLAIQAGWRDENDLANLIFFARHSELPAEPLKQTDPNFKQLSAEWTKILANEVWPAIEAASENTDLVVSGKEVVDHHRSFFRGRSGERLRKLVENAAKDADLNPGLLGTIMMAETRRPASYLSSERVSSYHIGTDDFFEARAAIKARVPAYAKVKWDTKQKPVEHLNDAKTNPRMVKTILFDSGADGALATAVYVKFREVRLREIAAESGKDFDSLPLPTRFALTRMAMAAGTEGARPFLKDALDGKDIFVRQPIPVREFQTKRNATVRTAQAMHLSDWIFGISVEPATPPATHELEEAWTEAEIDGDTRVQYDTPTTPTLVVVGQRIELDLAKSGFGAGLEQVRWTIPGTVVSSYEGTVNETRLVDLTNADLERPKISFFWVDAGKARTVQAKIRLKSGEEKQFTKVFDVEGPLMDSFTGDPGETRIEKAHATLQMQFGKPRDVPGIKWKWKITMPPHHAGFIKDIQTVLIDRTRIELVEQGKSKTHRVVRRNPSKPKPHVQLDISSDNAQTEIDPKAEPIYTDGLSETKREAGQSFDNGGGNQDSPGTGLTPLVKSASVNDQFTYYIMFKPVTDNPRDAIWVPVAKAKWFWKATATQIGGRWRLGKSQKMKPGIDMTTVEFPQYQSNVSENRWQEIEPAPSKEQFAEENDEFAGELFESGESPEPLMEELVPKVSQSDLRQRIDEFFDLAEAEYTLPNGNTVKTRSQFHIATVGKPEEDAEKLEKLLANKFGASFSKPLHTPIRCAAYGRARPDEIKVFTQHLIDAGELDAVRDDNPSFSDKQLVRALQAKFNIGIDCAGYVQLAFIFAFTGKHDDARCNLASSKFREELGLKSKRSDENLSDLPSKHFKEVGFLNGQTGDLLVLAWRQGERDWHTVIVVDHTVSGDVHTFLVDASWGFLYGDDAAGIARRTLEFDRSTGKWWDIHPIDGTKVNENSIGPYMGHPIKGMYRAKEK